MAKAEGTRSTGEAYGDAPQAYGAPQAHGVAPPVGRRVRDLHTQGVRLYDAARTLRADHARALEAVRSALKPLRDDLVAEELASIPVSRLKDVTEGRLRLSAIEAAGFGSVRAVHDASRFDLRQIPGVGAQTADQALAAARQIARAVEETVSVRIDVDRPEPRTAALVRALYRLVEAGPELRRCLDTAERLHDRLGELLPAALPATGRLRLALSGRHRRETALAAAVELRALTAEAAETDVRLRLTQASADLLREPASEIEAWVDFELRSAEYYSQLAEVSAHRTDTAAAEGFVPSEVAERVHAQPLDDTHRRVSLRGYQSFGARFALAQRRVVLGDEMGLGKTVQAVAALAHLAAEGHAHFLVVCPASVLINWTREIRSRSTLRALPVHGPERQDAYAEWRERGGVAVTTFDVLHTLPEPDGTRPGLLVVDEAHYVKNPTTLRSQAVARWAERAARVLFLTGTPMENRVEEFHALIDHLQPEVARRVDATTALAGAAAFQTAVAPAYLRRNQIDVLDELPELIPSLDWVDPTPADLVTYRRAVEAGSFMSMRRAAYLSVPTDGPMTAADSNRSAKLARLIDIVEEANEEGLKVVVFSYFRDVLSVVTRAVSLAVPGAVYGPITGSTAPPERQRLVDSLAGHSGGAVLVSQIEAGGVGLNIQAASVVVLCEPQWKPTIEAQAIARCHRMGQVRRVQVHRLLLEDSVDERMLEILTGKQHLIEQFVRGSAIKDAAPEAIDISDLDKVEVVASEAQAEALILASERRRLGLDPKVSPDTTPGGELAAGEPEAGEGEPSFEPYAELENEAAVDLAARREP
jgi:superfamily II DNA or RNA helicase